MGGPLVSLDAPESLALLVITQRFHALWLFIRLKYCLPYTVDLSLGCSIFATILLQTLR